MKKGLTYKAAGVNIRRAESLGKDIRSVMSQTGTGTKGKEWSLFASCTPLPARNMSNPMLVTCCDGVGTKLRLARTPEHRRSIGIDVVAMCVNDCITTGAAPFVFLDYFATGRLKKKEFTDILAGIGKGCRQSGCMLVGGETAELPGLFSAGDYDVAGFLAGVVDKKNLIHPDVRKNQLVWGLPSSGVHSNGFSLVNKILKNNNPRFNLLIPTRIYVNPVLNLIKKTRVSGMAHITGGGLPGNLKRILPGNVSIEIHEDSWAENRVFSWIEKKGSVAAREMFKTFNMGIGYVFITPGKEEKNVRRLFRGKEVYLIGQTVTGNRRINIFTRKGKKIIC